MLPTMIRCALTVLLAALATACASAARFAEVPQPGQIAFLVAVGCQKSVACPDLGIHARP